MPTTRRLLRIGIATVLIVAAFLAGTATGDRGPASPGGSSRRGEEASGDGPGPHRLRQGVPVGYQHTGRGAVAAAANAVATLGDPRALQPAGRARVLNAVAAANSHPKIRRRLAITPAVEEATGLMADVAAGRPAVAWVVPVASRLVAHSPDAATVEVWVVAVLGTNRLGAVTSSWSTETLRLVWERGDWRISGWASRSGPVPAATQPPTSLAETLAATERMRGHTHAPAS